MTLLPEIGPFSDYIWTAYGAAFLLLIGMAYTSLRHARKAEKNVTSLRPKDEQRK